MGFASAPLHTHREEEWKGELTLRRSLQTLLQSRSTGSDTILIEALLDGQKLHKTVDVGGLPLIVQFLWLCDFRLQKQRSGIGVRPVLGDFVFIAEVLEDLFDALVFTDKFQCRGGADFGNRVAVVTAEEDAKVDELCVLASDVMVGSDRRSRPARA
jgi:hypothetical protein